MKNITIKVLIISALAIHSMSALAQKPPMKFGKIDIKDLEMKVYEKDTSASAVVLTDYGTSNFIYNNDKGWQYVFKRHKRIKILKKSGYDFADGVIDYYDGGNNSKEKVTGLKGVTYNLEEGKIEKFKLDSKAIFDENKNKNWRSKKFTLPQVKEGSVIEYSYTITSDFIRFLRAWQFQDIIPVVWSEYRVKVPEFFNYQFLHQGYEPLTANESDVVREEFQYKWSSLIQVGGHVDKGTDKLESNSSVNRMIAKDVPAFQVEPHITSYNDYLTKISFELKSIKYRNSPLKTIMGTWNTLNKEFLESEYFGKKVSGSNYLKKTLETVLNGDESEQEKVLKIYNYVKKNVAWNGYYGSYLSHSNGFRDVIANKKGSAADINLLLTSMLNKAGVKSDPVLISTRDHGFIRPQYAISKQFNYVISIVELDDKKVLLDATDRYLPLGLLPERCLNGQGWVVSTNTPGWIDIKAPTSKSEKVVGKLVFAADGTLSGELENRYGGYGARALRKSFLTKGEKDYSADIKSESTWDIVSMEVKNAKKLSEPFIEKYEVELDSETDMLGDQIYFNPLIGGGRREHNPFKLEERKYPIDFASPIEEMTYITYTLPEGYHVEEQPKPIALALPNGGGKFIYNVNIIGNQMTVMSKLNIRKTLFVTSEYASVKEFFAQVIAKQSEQVVLKRD